MRDGAQAAARVSRALYHIINRGNYRRWIFDAASTRTAFETCLFEGCERSGWLLHAFVVMGNHYHLAVETPEGRLENLVREFVQCIHAAFRCDAGVGPAALGSDPEGGRLRQLRL